jgi:hypothetical protein
VPAKSSGVERLGAASGRRIAAIALVGVSLLAARDAAADYKDSYKKGLDAVEGAKWAAVEGFMREAIQEKPTEGEAIRLYGQRFETYLPHYYLGLALFQKGDCDGAVKSWDTSEAQGAVRKASQYKVLTKNKADCQVRLAKAPTPAPKAPAGPDPAAVAAASRAADAELARAEEASRAVAGLQTDPLLAPAWSQEAGLGPAQTRAAETLATARTRLDSGKRKPDLAQLGEAKELAANAASHFEAIRSTAQTRQAALRAEKARADAQPPRSTPTPLPLTPAGGAPGSVPADLKDGARAFFAGEYGRAIELLKGADRTQGRVAAQAFAIRAAARYALFILGGNKDQELLRGAEADVKANRQADAKFQPDSQAFSPRFVEFYRATR